MFSARKTPFVSGSYIETHRFHALYTGVFDEGNIIGVVAPCLERYGFAAVPRGRSANRPRRLCRLEQSSGDGFCRVRRTKCVEAQNCRSISQQLQPKMDEEEWLYRARSCGTPDTGSSEHR